MPTICGFVVVVVLGSLGIEPRALCMPGKAFTAKLPPQLWELLLLKVFSRLK